MSAQPKPVRVSGKLMWLLTGLIGIFALSGLGGCTVKAYEGPELPDDQISSITVHTSSSIQIDSVTIDGQRLSVFGDVFQVLSGNHTFELNYRAEHDDEDCDGDQYCSWLAEYGSCKGWLKTQAGRTYLISLNGDISYVRAAVYPKGYFDFFERSDEPNAGAISCGST